mmetsp:Transcript_17889/g.38009  ORF Transcript_17889/g.38009 Transcript_17889/m.38009 type:complete len:440 (-) Transcript_17889:81-1400(-)
MSAGSPMAMDPSILFDMEAENPQAEAGEGTSRDESWWQGGPDITQELNSIHAANATCAAFHADVAAKHAASLAQWVQYLWGQIASLQGKVVELEDWKKKTLDDMTKLRYEHKQLRRRIMPGDIDQGEDLPGLPGKAKSLPLVLSDHLDTSEAVVKPGKKNKAQSATSTPMNSSMRPPPGLEMILEAAKEGKTVRFSEQAQQLPISPPGASPTSAMSLLMSMTPTTPMMPGGPSTGLLSADESPELPNSRSISSVSESASSQISESGVGVGDEGHLEGVHVQSATVDGLECQSAEWRIGQLSTKLRGCMGRALVSSPFSAWGLEDLRLMVFPDGKEVTKGPRSKRQKELYAKKVSEGPLEGSLRLKYPVPEEGSAPHVLEYYLKIGSVRCGPFKHNFRDSTVNGCSDFGIDWLKQVDADNSLTVSVEIIRVGGTSEEAAV